MKNKQKTLSSSSNFTASVAIRAFIAKSWQNRRNAQRIRYVSSVDFWNTEIKENISALRELRAL